MIELIIFNMIFVVCCIFCFRLFGIFTKKKRRKICHLLCIILVFGLGVNGFFLRVKNRAINAIEIANCLDRESMEQEIRANLKDIPITKLSIQKTEDNVFVDMEISPVFMYSIYATQDIHYCRGL